MLLVRMVIVRNRYDLWRMNELPYRMALDMQVLIDSSRKAFVEHDLVMELLKNHGNVDWDRKM